MLGDILNDPGFRTYVALLHEPYHSEKWHENHPNVKFWEAERAVLDALTQENRDPEAPTLAEALIMLALPLYFDAKDVKQERLQWVFRLSKDEARLRIIAPALLALARSDPNYVSTRDMAEATGTSESPWRVRCQNGELPGAKLVGGNWIIPEYTLIRMGLRQ